ncbi:ion channel [Sungkyunkwania multivorans]|uniref:Ion channel n=1 Tax=Sungkyunkwania multivorans TaxID=1173618 RepID=A0ABW3CVR3_9FLAO
MAKKVIDPGLGTASVADAKRMVNKDGTFNIAHVNHRGRIFSAYKYLISISWGRFFFIVVLGYIVINSIFAALYVIAGIENIIPPSGDVLKDFLNAFFFSSQTITTVGYGAMAPKGLAAGWISTFEALIGLLSFSFITGLLYGRFAKPRASIVFSKHMIYRDFNNGKAIMFRLMNRRTNVMIQPRVKVTLSISEEKNGEFSRSFYQLQLERDAITYMPITWTIVHPLDDQSPLSKFSKEQLKKLNAELVILASYYDETFNQVVHQVHSYLLSETELDRHFEKAFYFDEDGVTTLDHKRLSKTTAIER